MAILWVDERATCPVLQSLAIDQSLIWQTPGTGDTILLYQYFGSNHEETVFFTDHLDSFIRLSSSCQGQGA
jgi:hypothetical protein